MSAGANLEYVLVVEWDASVVRPPPIVHHRLTLPAGSKEEEFEKFILENVLPQVERTSTRAGGVMRAYLLKGSSGFTDLRTALPPGVQDDARSFRMVAKSPGGQE